RTCLDLLRRGRRLGRLVAQMLDEVGHVGEFLLEVALVGLQALEQVGAVGKRSAEVEPSVPAMVAVVLVHCHLLSSYRSRKRWVRCCERRRASTQCSRR